MNEQFSILIRISLKFFLKGPTDIISTLVQVKPWRRTGGKPLPNEWSLDQFADICGTCVRWMNGHHLFHVLFLQFPEGSKERHGRSHPRGLGASGRTSEKSEMCAPLNYITVTSYWALCRLKSPASPQFTQPFIQAQIKNKHQSSASLAFVRGIHRWPANSPHEGPLMRKMFPFDDVIVIFVEICCTSWSAGAKDILPIGQLK